jgi:hypothetical protein
MSGRKRTTVTISEAEYQRLREQARRLERLQDALPELRGVFSDLQRGVIASVERMEERQQAFQRALNQVHQVIREVEAETARRLEEQQRRMREALGDIRREVRSLLKEQEERLSREIAEARQHLQTQIDALIAHEQRKSELALEWINAAQTLRDFIADNYPRHNHFCPGALAKLERDLRQAHQNLQQGVSEAAIASAQAAYHGLSDLRLELERLEAEWHLLQAAALRSTEEILALAGANRQCKAIDLSGKELDIVIEVDYWTEGKLSQLVQEVQELQRQIRSEEPIMSIDALRDVVERITPALRSRLEEIIWEARLRVLGSQLRINIADIAVEALEKQGFYLQDATYEGQDERGRYVVKVGHADGSEVVVVVTPKEGQYLENDLEIHSYDVEQWSEEILQSRANELVGALSAQGLQAPKPQQVAPRPDPSLRDIERIKQPRAKTEGKTASREN